MFEPTLGPILLALLGLVPRLEQNHTFDTSSASIGLVLRRANASITTGLIWGFAKLLNVMVNCRSPLRSVRRVAFQDLPASYGTTVNLILG